MPRSAPDDTAQAAGPWLVAADTGGTFTDAVARPVGDAVGPLRRVKVLSSSSLRTRVTRSDPDAIEVDGPWATIDGFAVGARLRVVGAAGGDASPPGGRRVAAHDVEHGRGRLRLEGRAADTLAAGTPIALDFDEPAPVLAARWLTATPAGSALPAGTRLRVATTRGTNALLERSAPLPALLVTEGFPDLLRIGDQSRPDLFDPLARRPAPRHGPVFEIPGRLDARGRERRPLDEDAVRRAAASIRAAGIDQAAIAFVHAWIEPAHEERAAAILAAEGVAVVRISSGASRRLRLLPRATAAVVDAMLAPVLGRYLDDIAAAAGGGGEARSASGARSPSTATALRILSSAGDLLRADRFRPSDGLLSGPAGGAVGAAAIAARLGAGPVIGFDMGGTSTDVVRIDGTPEIAESHRVGDVLLVRPAVAIETVAAGGGSICGAVDGRPVVGPRSAGADPGPACYGRGGPLTLTDVNLLLGRIDAGRFAFPLDPGAAERALEDVRRRLDDAPGRDALLAGFLDLADLRMAGAALAVTTRRGIDPAAHALVAFGGAGGQHALRVAERLGITRVLLPEAASVLSAVGLVHAAPGRIVERELPGPLAERIADGALAAAFAEAFAHAATRLEEEGVERGAIVATRATLRLRLVGQETPIEIGMDADAVTASGARIDRGAVERDFAAAFARLYGHAPPERPIEIASIAVHAGERTVPPAPLAVPDAPQRDAGDDPVPAGRLRAWFAGGFVEAPVHRMAGRGADDAGGLRPGDRVEGPALVQRPDSIVLLEPGWTAAVAEDGTLDARRSGPSPEPAPTAGPAAREAGEPRTIRRERFLAALETAAVTMGEQLRRTAISVNVKERLDFSCGVLDAEGRLLVHAPHVPVHLGALGHCVRATMDALDLAPGDVAVVNHPAFGGSHLPDVTVVAPVHERAAEDERGPGGRIAWLAARAHHAELGGIRPGSMPPDAASLADEGVAIRPMHLVQGGRERFDAVERLLRAGPHPSRAVDDNLADLRAQLAAIEAGRRRVRDAVRSAGTDEAAQHARDLVALSRRLVGEAFRDRAGTRLEAADALDDGTRIALAIDVPRDPAQARVRVDFTGTAPVHAHGFNAPPAVVASAVLYALRLLVGRDLPLNDGLLDAVELVLPPGSLLDPRPRAGADPDDDRAFPPVVAGNVETSQRVTDVLLQALGIAACGQGTMNNVVFGNDAFGEYETVAGGAGAGPAGAGESAVQVHMTNTRITDVEVLERRRPVVVERFAIRRGSGGAGRHRGGDGVERRLCFLEPVALSILAQRRGATGPPGAAGGEAGAPGEQWVERAGTEAVEPLAGVAFADLAAGDALVLRTPGGGGWGTPT